MKYNKELQLISINIFLTRDLARIFVTGCLNKDFKKLGCP